jgi:hypothetical protein
MKKIKILFFLGFLSIFFYGCQEDNTPSFPSSDKPTLVAATTEIFGAPNKKFEIKAAIADDLGLKTVRIQIAELSLDKVITFKTDPLLTAYDLSYFFEVPADRGISEAFKIKLTVTDVSENAEVQEINLRLDGEFDAPAISLNTPKEGSIILVSSGSQMNVNFTVNDNSGIDFVKVECTALGINDLIQLTGSPQSYTFNKSYTLPATSANYVLTITAKDKFKSPNTNTLNVNFKIDNAYPTDYAAIYLCDEPKGTDLTTDAVGVPMYFHTKTGQDFEFKYYANSNNKEIYFLGQNSDFGPYQFGHKAAGTLKAGTDSDPIILPTKGYYKIKVNPATLVYSVVKYTPTSTVYANIANGLWSDTASLRRTFVSICGGGIKDATWDTWDAWIQKGLHLANNPDNAYQLVGEITLTGTMEATFTGQWWDPSWRLISNGIATRSPGANGNEKYPAAAGVYKVVLDTELERAFITRK